MDLRLLLTVIAVIITNADCSCNSTIVYASTSSSSRSVSSSAYDYCTIYIRPYYVYDYDPYSNGYIDYSSLYYYLEISWSSSNFDVRGDMPFCKEDYVQVFLTRSYRSIGKFCSNNAGKPFTMYSRDGYAKIVHSTNGYTTGSGFKFYYRLRDKSSSPLGGTASSSYCFNTYNYATSGVIYSTGWPSSYMKSYSSCEYRISRSYGYQGVYVAFMDIHLRRSQWDFIDCLRVRASNSSTSYYEKTIVSSLCNANITNAYNVYSRYLKITFDRFHKSKSPYRGFVAGYVMFKKPPGTTDHTTRTSSNTTTIVLGVVIPIVIIAIIIIAVVVYTKKKQRPSYGPVHQGQPQAATTTSTQQTTQQTPQIASFMPNANYAYNRTQYVYPTATVQGGYPEGSCAMAYATGPYYPSGQFTTSAYGAPQVAFMLAPTYSSAPVGAVQPPLASGVQEQKPSGMVNPSYDGNALPPMPENAPPSMPGNAPPPTEASPSIPPPVYQAATSS